MLNGAVPPFVLDQGGLLLVLVRGFAVLGLLAAFGTLVFRSLVAPRAYVRCEADAAGMLDALLVRLGMGELAWAAVLLMLWLPVQAATIIGSDAPASVTHALPTLLSDTAFGHLVVAQLVCVAAAAATLWRGGRWSGYLAPLLAGAAVVLQVGHGHASAMMADASEPASGLLLGSDVVHLLAAGAWLGGLVPLLIVVRSAPCLVGAIACRWFSPLGKWCVVAMLATAVVQFWQLVGGLPGLLGTAYGWVACAKILLFVVLFGFALVNRYRLAPGLRGQGAEQTRRRLVGSIAVQSLAGLAVVVAAAMLSQLSPAMHTQVVWPFSEQPSLLIVQGDPEFRDEVLRAALALGAAACIVGFAVALRRRVWFAAASLLVAVILALRAIPHLGLLFIPATPTSFYHSPTAFSTDSIAAGAALYPQRCAACHGAEGRGDGPQAAESPVPPADLTAPHLWEHPDGELFWWISHGIEAPEGGLAMPGFSPVLDEDAVWALIDFLHANNAGRTVAASGTWAPPVQAPSFQMACGAVEGEDLTALRGRVVRLVFGPVQAVGEGVVTVSAGGPTAPGVCTTDDATVRTAYAVVTGVAPERLTGAEVLIDSRGWLRNVRPAAEGSAEAHWLATALQDIALRPLTAEHRGMMMMMHE